MLLLIANGSPLGPEWLDHSLKGEWEGHRECRVGRDFLPATKIDGSSKTGTIVFVRAGTHAELFQEVIYPGFHCARLRARCAKEALLGRELNTFWCRAIHHGCTVHALAIAGLQAGN